MWKEFKPAFLFLLKFIGIYLVGNIVYGLFITSYGNRPDPVTEFVTQQTSSVLEWIGIATSVVPSVAEPIVQLVGEDGAELWFYEGCNGINVMVVFLAFLVAFGGPSKHLVWFGIAGLLAIHLANLLRLSLLFLVVVHWDQYFYYLHKYLFTATIYVFVFLLWGLWIWKLSAIRTHSEPQAHA